MRNVEASFGEIKHKNSRKLTRYHNHKKRVWEIQFWCLLLRKNLLHLMCLGVIRSICASRCWNLLQFCSYSSPVLYFSSEDDIFEIKRIKHTKDMIDVFNFIYHTFLSDSFSSLSLPRLAPCFIVRLRLSISYYHWIVVFRSAIQLSLFLLLHDSFFCFI